MFPKQQPSSSYSRNKYPLGIATTVVVRNCQLFRHHIQNNASAVKMYFSSWIFCSMSVETPGIRWEITCSLTNKIIFLIYMYLTSELLSGGWVPVIPRSFHYWQPAPDGDRSHGWEILATQPWAPARQGRKQAPVTLRTSVEKGKLRLLDTVFQGQYPPSLSINYVAINKVLEKFSPQLY